MVDNVHSLLIVIVMSIVTAALRFAPFILFPEGRKRPKVVTYLGTVLPYALMGMLVVYCFKSVNVSNVWTAGTFGDSFCNCNSRLEAQHFDKCFWRSNIIYAARSACICVIGE